MTKEDFIQGIKLLGEAYKQEFTEEQVEIWYQMLGGYTKKEFKDAILELIKTEERLPSIAHITKQIAKKKVATIPDAEEEWKEVIRTVHAYGSYREKEALASLKPYTAKIVSYIGYFRICTSTQEEQTWNKKEFIGEYNSLKDKAMENLQIGTSERLMLNE